MGREAIGAAPSPQGAVQRDVLWDSPALGHEVRAQIYLPPGYGRAKQSFPVIYLLHGVEADGADWLDQGGVAAVANDLIRAGRLPGVILVMPDAGNSWYVDSEPGAHGAMARAIADDLTAWTEKTFHAATGPHARAIAGYSMGGFGALRLALAEPGRYAAVGVLSGAFWGWMKADLTVTPEEDERWQRVFDGSFGRPFDPARMVAASPASLAASLAPDVPRPRVFMACGKDDRFGLAGEQGEMAEHLKASGIAVEVHLLPGDHDWDTWRRALSDMLVYLGKSLAPAKPMQAPETAKPRKSAAATLDAN